MSEYDKVKSGKLVLKGEKVKKKKKSHKRKHENENEVKTNDEDAAKHGGWTKISDISGFVGTIAVEFGNQTYMKALDNGLFTLGAPHDEGDSPNPEEILTVLRINDNKIALKSGYGKYLGVSKTGIVVGRSDAVGAMEQWEPVFQDGKLAILSNLDTFISVNEDDDIICQSKTAGSAEFVNVRCMIMVNDDPNKNIPEEEQGTLAEVEENYVRKFQKFQDKKLKINTGKRVDLQKAKDEGNFHETLLNRRSKMKADRYCK